MEHSVTEQVFCRPVARHSLYSGFRNTQESRPCHLGVAVQACKLSTLGARGGGPSDAGQQGLYNEFQASLGDLVRPRLNAPHITIDQSGFSLPGGDRIRNQTLMTKARTF